MRRRVFLAGVLSGGIGLAGCLDATSSGATSSPSPPTQSTRSRTTDPTGPVTPTATERCEPTRTTTAQRADLVVENGASTSRTVSVEVRNATDTGSPVFERTYTVEAGSDVSSFTGVFTRREGTYEVRAALATGGNATRTIEVNPTSTTGSIVVVEVSGEEVGVRRLYVNFTPTPVGSDC